MSKPNPQAAQAPAAQVQTLLQAFNQGLGPHAEQLATQIVQRFPATAVAQSVLAALLAQRGAMAQALPHFDAAAQLQPKVAEVQFNLALALVSLQRHADAVIAYQRGLRLKPGAVVAHFNLGAAFQALGQLADAARCYQRAADLQPGYAEAWGNLGAVQQLQGQLDAAINAYRRALDIPDQSAAVQARLQMSLGSALHNQGSLDLAIAAYQQALHLQSGLAEAHDRLGAALRAQGNSERAVAHFRQALQLQPTLGSAHHHLAVFLQDSGDHAAAAVHFRQTGNRQDTDRALYCLYKAREFAQWRSELALRLQQPDAHHSPMLATLSAHHAVNFGTDDPVRFCPQPLQHILHVGLPELRPGSALLRDLLQAIANTAMAERKQGRLHNGTQSAGNLFRRSDPPIQALAALVRDQVAHYRQQFAASPCTLIEAFPHQPDFMSSWFISMRQGGHLTSHIHEEGWISGCVYLAMPDTPPGQLDGSIEFSTDGDDHPRLGQDFPVCTITPAVGDLVLFPSSLFHRTLPYQSDQLRICVAFDIGPGRGR